MFYLVLCFCFFFFVKDLPLSCLFLCFSCVIYLVFMFILFQGINDTFTSIDDLEAKSLGLSGNYVAQYVLRQQTAERNERQQELEERQSDREEK